MTRVQRRSEPLPSDARPGSSRGSNRERGRAKLQELLQLDAARFGGVADALRGLLDGGGFPEPEIGEHLLQFFGRFFEEGKASPVRGRVGGSGKSDVSLHWWGFDQIHFACASRTADHETENGLLSGALGASVGHVIFKDLAAYLLRELDDYLLRNVVQLGKPETDLQSSLEKAAAIRKVANIIIGQLAAAEEVRKRLWLKKKFVFDTRYLIRIDLVPKELYPEIARNCAQVDEWVELFGIDGAQRDERGALPETFLEMHPTLTVDTRHFDDGFAARLLEALGDLEERTDGVLVHGENFQALSLIHERYREKVDCIYIDPPYNTGNGGFVYHDRFPHSAWLSMMADRLGLAEGLLHDGGTLFVSIDGNERDRLALMAQQKCRRLQLLDTFVWVNNLKGRQIAGRGAAGTHEYVLAFGGPGRGLFTVPVKWATQTMPSAYKGFRYQVFEDERGPYVLKNELYNTNSRFNEKTRPNLVFNIHYNPVTREIRFSDVDETVEFEGFVKIPPHPNRDGKHRFHAWRWSRERILADSGDLAFVRKGRVYRIFTKVRDFAETNLKDLITDIFTSDGTRQLAQLFGHPPKVDYPKPVELVRIFVHQAPQDGWVLDFFAGSGTTGHAVIEANREEGSRRTFVLVEMGDHFETVLLPRLKKVVFAPEWKDGRPVRMPTAEEVERSPRILKVLRLESYEDALDSFALDAGEANEKKSECLSSRGDEAFILRYVVERDDGLRLNIPALRKIADPTSYRLRKPTPDSREPQEIRVDLVETFNWLLGLRVRRMWAPRQFRLDGEIRRCRTGLQLAGRLVRDAHGPYGFRAVEGELPEGQRALVIWRKLGGVPEEDDLLLEEWLHLEGFAQRLREFDVVYVNGSRHLESLKAPGDRWTVRPIEEELVCRIFDSTSS